MAIRIVIIIIVIANYWTYRCPWSRICDTLMVLLTPHWTWQVKVREQTVLYSSRSRDLVPPKVHRSAQLARVKGEEIYIVLLYPPYFVTCPQFLCQRQLARRLTSSFPLSHLFPAFSTKYRLGKSSSIPGIIVPWIYREFCNLISHQKALVTKDRS